MPNYLKMPKKSQILALLELGWSYRRIEAETGVRRETVSRYDGVRLANAAKAFPGSDASPPSESPDRPPSCRSPARAIGCANGRVRPTTEAVDGAAAVDAENAPTAAWKTRRHVSHTAHRRTRTRTRTKHHHPALARGPE